MTMRGGLLLLGIIILVGAALFAARQLGIGWGARAGTGAESIELVLQADGLDPGSKRVGADKALDNAREILARRVEAISAREASVSRQGANRIHVRVAGISDPAAVRALILAPGRFELRLVDLAADPEQIGSGLAPPGSEILPFSRVGGQGPDRIPVRRRVIVSSRMIEEAQQSFDRAGAPVVIITLNDEGARRLERVTRENVRNPIAFILDDVVLSAPMINEPVTGGSAQIGGAFSVESAKRLAMLINSGALPIKLAVVGEKALARAQSN